MGVPLEERREGRTSITPEFMEELESADTCSGAVGYLLVVPGAAAGRPRRGEGADRGPSPPRPCPDPQRCLRAWGPCSAASSRSAIKLFLINFLLADTTKCTAWGSSRLLGGYNRLFCPKHWVAINPSGPPHYGPHPTPCRG